MGQLFSLLLLVGFVGAYFKWIALAVLAYFGYRSGRAAWQRHCTAVDAWELEQKAIAARATNSTPGHSLATREGHTATRSQLLALTYCSARHPLPWWRADQFLSGASIPR
jgi:hypothetical protein